MIFGFCSCPSEGSSYMNEIWQKSFQQSISRTVIWVSTIFYRILRLLQKHVTRRKWFLDQTLCWRYLVEFRQVECLVLLPSKTCKNGAVKTCCGTVLNHLLYSYHSERTSTSQTAHSLDAISHLSSPKIRKSWTYILKSLSPTLAVLQTHLSPLEDCKDHGRTTSGSVCYISTILHDALSSNSS